MPQNLLLNGYDYLYLAGIVFALLALRSLTKMNRQLREKNLAERAEDAKALERSVR